MRSGIYLILPVEGPVRDQVLDVQRRYDPRLARGWPPHITLAGSSGMGPLGGNIPVPALRSSLQRIAQATPPIEMAFDPATRFMQTNVVVLPLDPHGPLRALHDLVRTSGLEYSPPRFAFTPHVTLSFYPELTPQRAQELLTVRASAPGRFERLLVYRSFENRTSRLLMSIPLGR